jgi:hypothetical protein
MPCSSSCNPAAAGRGRDPSQSVRGPGTIPYRCGIRDACITLGRPRSRRLTPERTPQTSPSTMNLSSTVSVEAEPYVYEFHPAHTALLIIDMQRDFLEPGGFGEMLGNDVSRLRRTIEPNQKLLTAWRTAGLQVIHTREGHRPDLSDLPPSKRRRGRSKISIGDPGPMGRILVRGEPGHDIIPELYPLVSETVVDSQGRARSPEPTSGRSSKIVEFSNLWSPESLQRSALTPPSEKPMIAVTNAWCWKTVWVPTFQNFRTWG